jgi:hypothetical protein
LSQFPHFAHFVKFEPAPFYQELLHAAFSALLRLARAVAQQLIVRVFGPDAVRCEHRIGTDCIKQWTVQLFWASLQID